MTKAAQYSQDEAIKILRRGDTPAEVIDQLSKNEELMKNRKIKLAVAGHPKLARRVAMQLLRDLFALELMQMAMNSGVPTEIRKLAEQALIGRMKGASLAERVELAKRGPGAAAQALLLDREMRVARAALGNARLSEAAVVKAILHEQASAEFVGEVCRHAKWSLRQDVRAALLRNGNTPLAKAVEYARSLPEKLLAEILQRSDLPENVKAVLARRSRE